MTERRNAGLPDAHLHNSEETPPHRGRRDPAFRAPRGHPPLPCRPPPRPSGRLRAGSRCLLPCRTGALRRAGHAAPAAQDPLRPLLSGGPAEADVRGGHQRPVRPQTGRDPLLCQPVRRRQGRGRDLPDRSGPVLPGRDPERPLRLPHPQRGTASPSTPTRPSPWRTWSPSPCRACSLVRPRGRVFFRLHDPSPVYLDHAATTPVRPEVLEAMLPYLTNQAFGNPSSAHRFGRAARAGIEQARREVAAGHRGGAQPGDLHLRRDRGGQPRHRRRGARCPGSRRHPSVPW